MKIELKNIGIQGTLGVDIDGALRFSVSQGKLKTDVFDRKKEQYIDMPKKRYTLSTKEGAASFFTDLSGVLNA